MNDKRFKELFEDLVGRYFDEFSEAVFVPDQADWGIGALLKEIDERLFDGENRKELEAEHRAITAHHAALDQWFNKGR